MASSCPSDAILQYSGIDESAAVNHTSNQHEDEQLDMPDGKRLAVHFVDLPKLPMRMAPWKDPVIQRLSARRITPTHARNSVRALATVTPNTVDSPGGGGGHVTFQRSPHAPIIACAVSQDGDDDNDGAPDTSAEVVPVTSPPPSQGHLVIDAQKVSPQPVATAAPLDKAIVQLSPVNYASSTPPNSAGIGTAAMASVDAAAPPLPPSPDAIISSNSAPLAIHAPPDFEHIFTVHYPTAESPLDVPSEVIPGLFLSSAVPAADEAWLREHGIRTVVNCAGASVASAAAKSAQSAAGVRDTYSFEMLDYEAYDARSALIMGAKFIASAVDANHPVLVHCAQGVSRSVAVVAAYLMRHKGMRLADALALLKSRRKFCYPNIGFLLQLMEMETNLGREQSVPDDAVALHRSYEDVIGAMRRLGYPGSTSSTQSLGRGAGGGQWTVGHAMAYAERAEEYSDGTATVGAGSSHSRDSGGLSLAGMWAAGRDATSLSLNRISGSTMHFARAAAAAMRGHHSPDDTELSDGVAHGKQLTSGRGANQRRKLAGVFSSTPQLLSGEGASTQPPKVPAQAAASTTRIDKAGAPTASLRGSVPVPSSITAGGVDAAAIAEASLPPCDCSAARDVEQRTSRVEAQAASTHDVSCATRRHRASNYGRRSRLSSQVGAEALVPSDIHAVASPARLSTGVPGTSGLHAAEATQRSSTTSCATDTLPPVSMAVQPAYPDLTASGDARASRPVSLSSASRSGGRLTQAPVPVVDLAALRTAIADGVLNDTTTVGRAVGGTASVTRMSGCGGGKCVIA